MKTNITYILVLLSAMFLSRANATTRMSTGSGNWATASTWSPSGVPTCGDTIVVRPTHTVTISSQQNYTGCTAPLFIEVYGKLMFDNGSKLSLPCGSIVVVFVGGVIDHDVGLASSNLINICGNVEWDSNSTLWGPACLPASSPYCAGILPVEFLSFSATVCDEKNVCLDWQTALESNNDHFDVERSINGSTFTKIAQVGSKAPEGNSLVKMNYSYIDAVSGSSVMYYRLRQVDRNGASAYSSITSVKQEGATSLIAFPNYNEGKFFLQLNNVQSDEQVTILLRDANGVIVYKALHLMSENENTLSIAPEPQLPKGNYYCSVITAFNEEVIKIIVTN